MNLLGIKIKNYKSIKDMDLNFTSNTNKIEKDLLFGNFKLSESKKKGVPAFIAIMGRNAIGKTSILEALSFLSDSVTSGSLSRSVDSANVVKKNLSTFSKNAGATDIPISIQITLDMPGKGETSLGITLSPSGNFITTHQKEDDSYLLSFAKVYFALYQDNHSFEEENLELDHCLYSLKANIGKKKLISLLRLADPAIKDIYLNDLKNEDDMPNTIVLESGYKIKSFELSKSTKQFLIIIEKMFESYNFENSLAVIDDIELTLHKELSNIIQWMMIEMFAEKNIQFIFTTNSPLILNDVASNKQIYIIEGFAPEQSIRKASTIMKSHENIVKYYRNGRLSSYPDKEKARNSISDFFKT